MVFLLLYKLLYIFIFYDKIGAFISSPFKLKSNSIHQLFRFTKVLQNTKTSDEVDAKLLLKLKKQTTVPSQINTGSDEYDGDFYEDNDEWKGSMDGFDWQLERARRLLEGPAFSPLRMTLWQPNYESTEKKTPPGMFDQAKILFNNALQMTGLAESLDGAPLVQGVNTFKGSPLKLLSKVIDGDLAELAGGPLFLLLNRYYKEYGSVFKLAFGPKSFIVVSDPILAKHILKESPGNYDKGILAEILEPVMGKVLYNNNF